MNEINLLRQRKSESGQPQKAAIILRLIAIVCLSIVGLSSVSLFLVNISSPLSPLRKEEDALISTISTYQDRLNANFVIEDRLKNISSIFSKRTNYSEKIGYVIQGVPQNVSISFLSIDGKNIQISASSVSLLALDTFINNTLELTTSRKIIKRLVMNSLSFDAKGEYILLLQADLL